MRIFPTEGLRATFAGLSVGDDSSAVDTDDSSAADDEDSHAVDCKDSSAADHYIRPDYKYEYDVVFRSNRCPQLDDVDDGAGAALFWCCRGFLFTPIFVLVVCSVRFTRTALSAARMMEINFSRTRLGLLYEAKGLTVFY